MLYAVIADVHGNYPALKAVFEDAQKEGVQQYLFLGDYFTDFPFTHDILEALANLENAVFVSGNREWYMETLNPAQRHLEQYASLFLTRDALGEKGLSWIGRLPKSARLSTPDGSSTLFLEHAYPVHTDSKGRKSPASGGLDELFPMKNATHQEVAQYVKESFRKNPNLPEILGRINAQVYLHGHSHLQYAVELDGTLFLNPGSCGLPLDQQSGAPYTLLQYEAGSFRVKERRVSYDVERVIRNVIDFPKYGEAAGWYQLINWQLSTSRDHSRTFSRFLQEEKECTSPQTDQENNQTFHRALSRTLEYYKYIQKLR